MIDDNEECPDCNGIAVMESVSSLSDVGDGLCDDCSGSGVSTELGDLIADEVSNSESDCPTCSGTGQCQTCGGNGVV